MSRYEQVRQEVIYENGILKEQYDSINSDISTYRPRVLSVDEIIDATTRIMIRRRNSISRDIPTDDDKKLFAKVLWVVLEEHIGGYEFLQRAEHNLYNTLKDRCRQLLPTMDL